MLTLTYGYKVPETNDRGSIVFPALEANFTRLDGHDHDGVNSKKIPGSSLQSTVVSISAAAWGSDLGGGYYSQVVNVPTGVDYDAGTIEFRTSTGERLYPKVTRVSGAQVTVFCADNTLAMKAYFN